MNLASESMRKQALCDCGWRGKRRWTRSSAVLDAGQHAAATGHLLTSNWVQAAQSAVVHREPEVIG